MVYVRTADGDAASPYEPSALVADSGTVAVTAETLIATTPGAPLRPLAVAIEEDPALRDTFARAIGIPSIGAWARLRLVALVLAAVPLLLILELDREHVTKGLLGGGRLVIDLLAFAYVGFELTRKTPRLPVVAAVTLAAVALRWLLVAARLCAKDVSPVVWIAAGCALASATLIAVRAPTRARIVLELLDRLGISPAAAAAVRRGTEVSNRLFGAVLAATAALPILAWQLRSHRASLVVQGAVILAIGVAAPRLVRLFARESAPAEPLLAVRPTLVAIVAGLALTASLLYGAHHFFDVGAELARCTNRLEPGARKLMALEAAELARRIASVRESAALVVLTVVVVPFAEEQIFRGLLLNVLKRRYGLGYGLFVSSLVFGFTHLGVYEIALYQTVLLGAGFGLAYAEGGLVAAFVVHAVWNLLNVA